jgi:hypothetical protein
MVQGRYIFDPPPTRINAQGFVEDIPAEETCALEGRDADARPSSDAKPPARPSVADVVRRPPLSQRRRSRGEPGSRARVEPPPADAPKNTSR